MLPIKFASLLEEDMDASVPVTPTLFDCTFLECPYNLYWPTLEAVDDRPFNYLATLEQGVIQCLPIGFLRYIPDDPGGRRAGILGWHPCHVHQNYCLGWPFWPCPLTVRSS